MSEPLPELLIKIYEDPEPPYELLLDADPSKKLVDEYLKKGKLFAAYIRGRMAGEYLLMKKGAALWELMNIALSKEYRGKGLGGALLKRACETARNLGAERLQVGTGSGCVRFYEKYGFKVMGKIENFFTDNYDRPIIENGETLKDMIRLELDL